MDGRLSVLFLVSSLGFGGAEKQTVTLLNHLDVSAFRLGLVYFKRVEHLLPELDSGRLDQVYCPDFGRGMDWRGLLRLTIHVKRWRPQVVVCVNQYPLFFGHIACFLAGVPASVVEIFHTTELPNARARRQQKFYRWFFNRSDRIIYVSKTQRRYWESRGLRVDRGHCIHNGIDTAHFRDLFNDAEKSALRARLGFGDQDFVVGICAALRPEKRHVDLLEAVALLRSRGYPAKCLIVGDGPERGEIEARIGALGLSSHVAITGFQEDVRPHLSICDCVTIVSNAVETFSIAALEAMALGKPLVMSDIGGASEQIVPGENGFLFARGDISGLADYLGSLGDPARRARLGTRAREIIECRFGLDQMVSAYGGVFRQLGMPE